jgi:hypothetical protein
MVRWVAFDDDTAEAVVCRLRRGAAEIQANSPVDAALKAPGPSVILLPSQTPGKLLIARIQQRAKSYPASPGQEHPPAQLAAPILSKKPAASLKKPWWRRFVA